MFWLRQSGAGALDRGDKLDEYRTIDTLEEYVLIDSRRRWVETYRRVENTWIASLPTIAGDPPLTSVNITLALEHLYETVGIAPTGD